MPILASFTTEKTVFLTKQYLGSKEIDLDFFNVVIVFFSFFIETWVFLSVIYTKQMQQLLKYFAIKLISKVHQPHHYFSCHRYHSRFYLSLFFFQSTKSELTAGDALHGSELKLIHTSPWYHITNTQQVHWKEHQILYSVYHRHFVMIAH